MRYRYLTADVFTDRPFGGNPLAVFPDARGISSERMQQVAREMNLSETVFVLPPEDPRHTRKLRIFTPGTELPFAGHPTVGTAFVLAAIGEIPLAGAGDPDRLRGGGRAGAGADPGGGRQAGVLAAHGGEAPRGRAAAPSIAGSGRRCSPWSRRTCWTVKTLREAVSCGVPFLYVPLRDRDAVRRARIRTDRWEKLVAGFWATEVYVFARDPELPGSHVRSRMFAPRMGIVEDPATGAATASFGGYLASRAPERDGTLRWVIEQGFEMGRPSILASRSRQAGRPRSPPSASAAPRCW